MIEATLFQRFLVRCADRRFPRLHLPAIAIARDMAATKEGRIPQL